MSFVLRTMVAAAAAFVAAASRAAAAPCTTGVLGVQPVGATTYAAVLVSTSSVPHPERLFIVAGSAAYDVRFPEVRFERPIQSEVGRYESQPLFFRMPTATRVRLAAITRQDEGGGTVSCDPSDIYISGVALAHTEAAALQESVSADTGEAGSTQPAHRLGPLTKDSCEVAQAAASVIEAVQPQTPGEAAREHATGVVELDVTVGRTGRAIEAGVRSSSGNQFLDVAGRQAALDSLYRPPIVRCSPIAGPYVFRVEFAGA
jgi:TonB family protein